MRATRATRAIMDQNPTQIQPKSSQIQAKSNQIQIQIRSKSKSNKILIQDPNRNPKSHRKILEILWKSLESWWILGLPQFLGAPALGGRACALRAACALWRPSCGAWSPRLCAWWSERAERARLALGTKEVLGFIRDFLDFNYDFLGFPYSCIRISQDLLGFILGFYQDFDSIRF